MIINCDICRNKSLTCGKCLNSQFSLNTLTDNIDCLMDTERIQTTKQQLIQPTLKM